MKELFSFVNLVINGLMIGSLYATMTLGLTLLFGVMGVINVAQADFIVLSAYIAYWMFHSYGLSPFLSFIVTVPVMFVIGMLLEKGLIEPLQRRTRSRGEFVRMTLPVFFGVAMVVRHSMTAFWTGDYRAITTHLTGKAFTYSLIRIPVLRLMCLVGSLGIVGLLYLYLTKTKTGKQIRAISQNVLAANIVGINVERIRLISFSIGICLAGFAGYLFSFIYTFFPGAAGEWVPLLFCIMVTGGLGCTEGTLVVGIIFGLLDGVIGYYFSMALSRVLVFITMLLVLLFRPRGIFGRGL
jgi:branched-chain amino acid transport system permease protein